MQVTTFFDIIYKYMETQKMGKLIFVRHTLSEWNSLGLWTGVTDVHLSEEGFRVAGMVGKLLKDFSFDHIFKTRLVRTQETLSSILDNNLATFKDVPIEESEELIERDYGDYTGKNKWEVKKEIGDEEFMKIRRSWDHPIPNGESLKMVYERAVPFFLNKILPLLKEGKNVLVVGHGNTLRSLSKYIENISDVEINNFEIDFDIATIYDLDKDGHIISKEILKAKSN
jgi:2,3-bisphosphoglycerate-dependent phosphoglycerate mutase